MKKYYGTLTIITCLMLCITGCSPDKEVDKAVYILNDAIQKMDQQSSRWQDVLTETRDKLVKDSQSTIANEVSNILSEATSDVGIEAKCYTDFLRDRTKDELVKLRATLTGEKLLLRPVFCSPTPKSIDMNIAPDRRPVITISGYNLTQDALKVFLVGRESPKIDVSDKLSNPTSYLLTLNLGSNGVPLSDKSDKIIFQLPNGEEKSIGITQPIAPPPKVQFLKRRIHVTGTIDMGEKESWLDPSKSDEKLLQIDSYIEITSDKNASYHWEDCVGGEVQGYIDVQLQLDKDTGDISGQGLGRYYEGTRCGATNSRGSKSFNMILARGKSFNYQYSFNDAEGHITYNLTFKNED